MLRFMDRPSLSTYASARKMFEARPKDGTRANSQILIGRWTTKVDPAAERRAFEVLDAFGIDLYQFGSTTPRECYRVPADVPPGGQTACAQ